MKRTPLAATHPEVAAQADGWDPSIVSAGSAKKLPWRCPDGHAYSAVVYARVSGTGCPYCSGRLPIVGVNDLATTHPDLAAETDGWDPTTLSAGSGKERRWRCAAGHSWAAIVGSRAKKGSGCPVCANYQVVTGVNDLATLYPEVATQACGWDPSVVGAGSAKRLRWRCALDHEWVSPVEARVRAGATKGCPICANKVVLPGFNDLGSCHPDLAAQWHPTLNGVTRPEQVVSGSHRKVWWQCSIGHAWDETVVTRTRLGTGCPICSSHRVLAGYNDLLTTHADLAAEAVGWDPTTVLAGSNKKLGWRCRRGHEWRAVVASRALSGASCPICSGNIVLAGYNDLLTTHADLAAEAAGWDPRAYSAGSNKRVRWTCGLHHEWTSSISHRTSRGDGCPYCSGRRVLAGFNDLATTDPALAAQAVGWDPRAYSAGSNKRVRWACGSGHEWSATVVSRAVNGSGCPTCATHGYDPNEPGYLYLLRHEAWGLLQVGITNVPKSRLKQHARSGWELLDLLGPMDGSNARGWERDILDMLKIRSADLAPANVAGRFSGYTEAWVRSSLPVSSLRQLMNLVRDRE